MIRRIFTNNNHSYIVPLQSCNPQQRRMASYLAFKPKNQNEPSVQAFTTDQTGQHVVQTTIVCDKKDCTTRVCTNPCGEIVEMQNTGVYTHKPPVGSISKFLDATDFKGQTTPQGQHFVKPNVSPTLSAEDLKNLTETDLKPDQAATAYSKLPHIFEKVK